MMIEWYNWLIIIGIEFLLVVAVLILQELKILRLQEDIERLEILRQHDNAKKMYKMRREV